MALLLAWLWRLLLVVILFARIGRLDLSLVLTHPDRAGGLDFVQALPGAFAPVSLALSAVIAALWGTRHCLPRGHAASAETSSHCLRGYQRIPVPVTTADAGARIVCRQAAGTPGLRRAGRRARAHGARRWILREPVADPTLLEAAEIGPVADTAAIYGAVNAMRLAPIGMRAMLAIVLPIALPMLVAAALQIPLKEIVLKLLKALV